MPITNAEARDKFLPGLRREFQSRLIFRNFTNRHFEGDAQNAQTLRLTNVTSAFTADTTAGRDVAMPAHQGTDIAEDTLNMDQRVAHSAYEANLDVLEGPADLLPRALMDQARVIADQVDQNIRAYLASSVPNANDGVDTAGLRKGSDDDYVGESGNASSAAARKLVPTLIREVNHRYRASNFWKTGEDEYQPLLVMPNALWTAMLEYIDEDKPSDRIVEQFTRSDGVTVGGLAGVWKDIPVLVTNRLPTVTVGQNTAARDFHQVLVTNPQAITAAFRAPVMEVNQGFVTHQAADGTMSRRLGWTSDVEGRYGRVRIANNVNLLYRFLVQQTATA